MGAVAYIGEWFQTAGAGEVIERNRKRHAGEMEVFIGQGSFRADGTPSPMSAGEEAARALDAGADIALRLPVIAVLSGWDVQAFATLTLADRLRVIETLAVPVTDLNAELLEEIAMLLFKEPMSYQKEVRRLMEEGMKYPKARAKAAESAVPGAERALMNSLSGYAVELRLAALRRYSRVKLELVETAAYDPGAATGAPGTGNLPDRNEGTEAASGREQLSLMQEQKLAEALRGYLGGMSDGEILSVSRMTPSFPWSAGDRLIARRKEILKADRFGQMAEMLEGDKVTKEQVRRGLLMMFLGVRLPNLSIAGLDSFGPYVRAAGFADLPDKRGKWEEVLQEAETPVIGAGGEILFCGSLDESRAHLAGFDIASDRLWQEISA